MIKAILACSAATPALMFTFLLLKFNLQQCNKETYLAFNTTKKPDFRLEQFFEKHFERLIAVELHGKHQYISAYIDAKSNGCYRLLTIEGTVILVVKKGPSGWSVLQEGKTVNNAAQFLTPLIILLEQKFYN